MTQTNPKAPASRGGTGAGYIREPWNRTPVNSGGVQQFAFTFGGSLSTMEQPIQVFPGDIVVNPGTVILKKGLELPRNCTGFRIIATGQTVIRVNGGGLRTILSGDTYQGCLIDVLEVTVSAGTATVQPWGVGD